mgnify:FL=1
MSDQQLWTSPGIKNTLVRKSGQILIICRIIVSPERLTNIVSAQSCGRGIGLAACGHTGGDCHDIEILIPSSNRDRTYFYDQQDIIHEICTMTPLTGATRFVANSLRDAKENTTMILVSDGAENCYRGDTFKAMRRIWQQLLFLMLARMP